jgi:hypothetical protein
MLTVDNLHEKAARSFQRDPTHEAMPVRDTPSFNPDASGLFIVGMLNRRSDNGPLTQTSNWFTAVMTTDNHR